MALETLLASTIPSPFGPLRLRRETEADDAFLFGLFCEARPELMLLPGPMRATVLTQQYRAQATSYAARYEAALKAIVNLDGEAVGRLIVEEASGDLHLVDIAVSSALRGKGLGTAILAALTSQARAMGRSVRLPMRATPQSRRSGSSISPVGFREAPRRDDANIPEMHWRSE